MKKCSKTKADNTWISEQQQATYLGDELTNDMNNMKTVQKRVSTGLGSISEILSILNQVSLGAYYFEIALVLRETILISKMIFNTESWYNITNEQLNKLHSVDLCFLKRLMGVMKTVPN